MNQPPTETDEEVKRRMLAGAYLASKMNDLFVGHAATSVVIGIQLMRRALKTQIGQGQLSLMETAADILIDEAELNVKENDDDNSHN